MGDKHEIKEIYIKKVPAIHNIGIDQLSTSVVHSDC